MLLPRPSARKPSTQPLTRLERMYEKILEPTMSRTVTAVEEWKEMRTTLPPLTPTCHRVLDCPGLPDEFYITPLDRWGEFVAIGLQDTVYLYSFASNSIVHTIPVAPCIQGGAAADDGADDGVGDPHYVSSVKFIEDGSRVIAGTSSGHLCMYDVSTGSVCSSVRLCDLRINIMAWNANKKKLSVGGDGGGLYPSCDVSRSPSWTWSKTPPSMAHGTSLVCGVRWNVDGTLLATSGDDDRVLVFDASSLHRPRDVLTAGDGENAGAGTKALSWSPRKKYVLAAGSGVRHGCVRLFDVREGKTTECAHHFTGAQIAGLEFVDATTIFCACGYPTGAVSTLKWSPDIIGGLTSSELQTGHATRTIAASKGVGGSVATVGIDGAEETLRLWNVQDIQCSEQRERQKKKRARDWGICDIR